MANGREALEALIKKREALKASSAPTPAPVEEVKVEETVEVAPAPDPKADPNALIPPPPRDTWSPELEAAVAQNKEEYDNYAKWREEAAEAALAREQPSTEEAPPKYREWTDAERQIVQYFQDNPDKLPPYLKRGTTGAKLSATTMGRDPEPPAPEGQTWEMPRALGRLLSDPEYTGPGSPRQGWTDWALGKNKEGTPDSPHYAAAGTFPENLQEILEGDPEEEIFTQDWLAEKAGSLPSPLNIGRGDPTTKEQQFDILARLHAEETRNQSDDQYGGARTEALDEIMKAYHDAGMPMPRAYSKGSRFPFPGVANPDLPLWLSREIPAGLEGWNTEPLLRNRPTGESEIMNQQRFPYNEAPLKYGESNLTARNTAWGDRTLEDIEKDLDEAYDARGSDRGGERIKALKKERDIIHNYYQKLAEMEGFSDGT